MLSGSGYKAVIYYEKKGECSVQTDIRFCDVEKDYCLHRAMVYKNGMAPTDAIFGDDCFLTKNPMSPDVEVGDAFGVRRAFYQKYKRYFEKLSVFFI